MTEQTARPVWHRASYFTEDGRTRPLCGDEGLLEVDPAKVYCPTCLDMLVGEARGRRSPPPPPAAFPPPSEWLHRVADTPGLEPTSQDELPGCACEACRANHPPEQLHMALVSDGVREELIDGGWIRGAGGDEITALHRVMGAEVYDELATNKLHRPVVLTPRPVNPALGRLDIVWHEVTVKRSLPCEQLGETEYVESPGGKNEHVVELDFGPGPPLATGPEARLDFWEGVVTSALVGIGRNSEGAGMAAGSVAEAVIAADLALEARDRKAGDLLGLPVDPADAPELELGPDGEKKD